jgi:hypothetical protein
MNKRTAVTAVGKKKNAHHSRIDVMYTAACSCVHTTCSGRGRTLHCCYRCLGQPASVTACKLFMSLRKQTVQQRAVLTFERLLQ